MTAKSKFKDYDSIAIFLIFELAALVSFCLGGEVVVFHYVGFAISLIAFLFASKNYDKRELKSLLIIGVPVVILAFCLAFGNLYGGFTNGAGALLYNFGVFLAIIAFFMVGLSARRLNNLRVETLLLCIGFGTALLVLISLVITWVQYGMFYTLLYRDTPAYYYDGSLYNVTKEMSWLTGFKVSEMSLKYTGLFGVLLCSALPALMFIDPKTQTRKFAMVAVIGVVGLFSILTIVNLAALLFLIPILVVALIYKFFRENKKFWKIATFTLEVVAGFIAVFLVFALLNALVPSINEFTSNNAALNRLFNGNRIMAPFNEVMGVAFRSYNLFGFPLSAVGDIEGRNEAIIFNNSGSFELEVVKEGGVFALIALLAIIVIMVLSTHNYLKRSKDSNAVKVVLVSFLVAFFFYATFEWDNMPYTHRSEFLSFGRSIPALILFMILGLVYFPFMKEEPLFNQFERKDPEVKVKQEVEYIDKDYVFTDANSNEDDVDDGKDSLVV